MKRLSLPRRARRADDAPARSTSAPVTEQAQWVRSQELTTTATRWGIWIALACGVAAMVMIALGVGRSAPAVKPRPAAAADIGGQAAAQEFARSCVLNWLQAKRGDERSLAPCFDTTGVRLPATQTWIASDAAIARIVDTAAQPSSANGTSSTTAPAPTTTAGASGKRTQQKVYAVTVAVSLRGLQDPPSSATRRYFSVPVVLINDAPRALALPGEVAAPPVADNVSLAYRNKLGADSPVAATVRSFLSALAAGDGEVSRYLSPGTTIRPITPAPYKSVDLLQLESDQDLSADKRAPADGRRVQVLATAEMRVDESRSMTTQYALTMVARGGRWEVNALDQSPMLPTTLPTTAAPNAASAPSTATHTTTPKQPSTTTAKPAPATPAVPGSHQ